MLILTLSLSTFSVNAQKEGTKWSSATGVNFAFPTGDMSGMYNFGWGIYGDVNYNFSKFLIARFDVGWNQFSGDDYDDPVTGLPEEMQQSVWEFTGGLRVKLAFVYAEFRGGYFTGVDSWGYVPAVGLKLGRFDIQGNYNIAGDNHWWAARVSYYFGHM